MSIRFFPVILLILVSCSYKKPLMDSFHPGKMWTDKRGVHINAHGGGILFHDDIYYWYGEHKVEGDAGNSAQVGVHLYTSSDLLNWEDQGIALKVITDDPDSEIARGCILERPKVIYNARTRKFVMWFHLELLGMEYDAARTGVAISDRPQGPFTFVKSFRPNAGFWPVNVEEFHKLPVSDTVKEKYCGGLGCLPAHVDSLNILGRDFHGGQMARDMNLFVDSDGKGYHLYSSEENSTLHISELTDDYLSYSGKYVRLFPNRYMEAPTIFKTNDSTYYFIGSDCTGWNPNAARSAVARNIFGPWKELGNPCIGADSSITFNSQSTFILPVEGVENAFIFMADRWKPENHIDGTYVWLPISFEDDGLYIRWFDQWNLTIFK